MTTNLNTAKEIGIGLVVSKMLYGVTRKYFDPSIAKYFYKPSKYVTELVQAGYTHPGTETEEQIATHIMESSGYTFTGGPGNLVGATKSTANEQTFMAAAGQKLKPYALPSTWTVERLYEFMGSELLKKNNLIIRTAVLSFIIDAAFRAADMDTIIASPSGFDTSEGTTIQSVAPYKNVERLAAETQRLRKELATLQATPRNISVQEIPVKNPASLMMETEIIPKPREESRVTSILSPEDIYKVYVAERSQGDIH